MAEPGNISQGTRMCDCMCVNGYADELVVPSKVGPLVCECVGEWVHANMSCGVL